MAYVTRLAKTDHEKARAIYRWITQNIAYDVKSYRAGKVRPSDPEDVLRSGVAVCSGYAGLYQHLATLPGLEVVRIEGFAKGLGYAPSLDVSAPNHAWNAVKLDGRWHLVDATWGAGAVVGSGFVRTFEDFWFLASPEQVIFSHFPNDPTWQLLDEPLSSTQFSSLAFLRPHFFEMGFEAAELRAYSRSAHFRGVPKAFGHEGQPFRVVDVPLGAVLDDGGTYHFKIAAPTASRVVIVNAGKWNYLAAGDGVFTDEVTVRAGEASGGRYVRGTQSGHSGVSRLSGENAVSRSAERTE